MFGGRARQVLPSVRLGRSTLIWLTKKSAYKLFWGTGARTRYDHEIHGFNSARACTVWGPHLLSLDQSSNPQLLRTTRGRAIAAGSAEDSGLFSFVEDRLRAAAQLNRTKPALELIEIGKLMAGLSDSAMDSIIGRFSDRLHDLMLSAGPVHGDLHRGNLIEVDGRYFVIDCDRFNPLSSPLFDRIHFSLTERKLRRPLKWVELLSQSDDLVASAIEADGAVSGTPAQVALAYGMNRLALEAFAARIDGRPRRKYREFALRLLDQYAGGPAHQAKWISSP